jgi:acyl-CoA thioester hydrolase
VLGDKLKLKTYIKNSSGAMATRVVKFYLNDLEIPIVVSETDWCLLDSFSFKPKRIPLNVSDVFL